MSKAHSRQRTGTPPPAKPHQSPARTTPLGWTHLQVARLPRGLRILLAGSFAIGLTMLLFPLVDYIYIAYFLTPDTRILPSFVSAGAGLVMYLAGWYLMVGTSGAAPAEQVRNHPALLVYLVCGISVVLVVTGLIIQGVAMTDLVAG